MMLSAIFIIGIISYTSLPVEFMPNTSSSWISISIRYPNMSPYTIEENIVKPIEDKVSEIGGIKNIFSTSTEGEGKVNIEFIPSIDIKKASIYVRQKVELIRNKLPKEANEPEIRRYNPNETPIFITTLKGENLKYIRSYAENYLKPKIERIEGVSNVSVSGGKVREIEVNVDLAALKAYSLGINKVIQYISASNLNLPIGEVEENGKKVLITLLSKFKTLKDIEEIGIPIQVGEEETSFIPITRIAEIKDGNKEKESIAKENGSEIISIYIQKSSHANTIEVARAIKDSLSKINIPNFIKLDIVHDQSSSIKKALKKVKQTGLLGSLIAMIVILIFLKKLKETLILGISLPLSIFLTFAGMYFFNISLNLMTLSGLVLGIGMLVDNSIVILESIENDSNIYNAVKKVVTPIIASTCTTVVVFFPLVMVDVITRKTYGDFALVIAFSLTSSLIVSILFVPTLAKYWKFNYTISSNFLFKLFSLKIDFQSKYKRILLKSLLHRGKILILFAIILISSFLVYPMLKHKQGGLLESQKISADISFPSGITLKKAENITNNIEKELKSRTYIKRLTTKVEKEKTTLHLEIDFHKLNGSSIEEIIEHLNKKFARYKDATIRFDQGNTEDQKKEVTIEIKGERIPVIKDIARKLARKIYKIEGIQSVVLRFKNPRPEISLTPYKEKLAQIGLSSQALAQMLKNYIAGAVASKFFTQDRQIDIMVKLKNFYRKDILKFPYLLIKTKDGQFIPLKSIAQTPQRTSESKIWRKNKQRMVGITAYFDKQSLGDILNEFKIFFKNENLPENVNVSFGEDYKELKNRQMNLFFAVILAFVLVFMVLASLYESYILPLIIISSVPLALISVIFYMYLTGLAVSLSIYIGLIVLVGIVVNNGIVLIDEMKHENENMGTILAIFRSSRSRLRPVFMTTATTVFSLLPMALNNAEGSLWSSMAQVIIVGLVYSALLIFILIPVLYSFIGKKLVSKKKRAI